MKDLLKFLPQILSFMPEIVKYIKYIPILMVFGGIGYGAYYFATTYKDPYKCHNNEIYERMSIDSEVYKFKGGYCVNLNVKD
jgi:hypothetical protein